MEPITLKFKMADAEQVSAAVVEAVRSDFNLDEILRNQAAELWRTVNLALFNAGCVIIQVDNSDQHVPNCCVHPVGHDGPCEAPF